MAVPVRVNESWNEIWSRSSGDDLKESVRQYLSIHKYVLKVEENDKKNHLKLYDQVTKKKE